MALSLPASQAIHQTGFRLQSPEEWNDANATRTDVRPKSRDRPYHPHRAPVETRCGAERRGRPTSETKNVPKVGDTLSEPNGPHRSASQAVVCSNTTRAGARPKPWAEPNHPITGKVGVTASVVFAVLDEARRAGWAGTK